MANQDTGAAPADLALLLQTLNEKLDALVLSTRAAAMGPERELQFLFHDKLVKMYLPFADVDVIQRHILLHRTFFESRSLVKVVRHVARGSVVLDAGANIGNHAIFFSKICGAKEVHAFEVMRETFKILERNVLINGLTGIHLHNIGLGARHGRAEISHFAQANIGASSIEPVDGGDYEIVPIDSLNLETVDFMKVDVEGSFLALIEGARETIARCRPKIWMELREQKDERPQGEKLMGELGYRITQKLSRNDFLFEPD